MYHEPLKPEAFHPFVPVPGHELLSLLVKLRELEQECEACEQRYRTSFEQASVGVAHVAQDLRFLSASDSFCAFTGYNREELLAMPFLAISYPDDLHADLIQFQRMAAGEIDGFALERRYIRKDGSVVWGHLTVALLRDIGGAALYQVAVVVDITERKAAEAARERARLELERLRAILDTLLRNVPAGVSICEAPSGGLVYYNDEAVRLLRHPPVPIDHRVERVLYGALHLDGTPYAPHEYPQSRALAGEPVEREDILYCRGDGMLTQLSVSAAPVRNERGEVIFAVSTFEDVSARHRIEAELREAAERAEAAIRVKRDFLETMNRELRTPLTSILGFCDLLLMGLPETIGESSREQVARMRDAAGNLLGRIEEMFAFAGAEAGVELHRLYDSVDVQAFLEEVATAAAPAASEKHLSLTTEVAGACDTLKTDVRSLRQVMLHLVTNAVQYTDEGGVQISAKRDGAVIEFSVRDSGIGISPQHVERIIDPSGDLQSPRHRPAGGIGEGLVLVHRLTRLLRGELFVESKLGRGSTFRLRIPVGDTDTDTAA